jgi:hypothetical protein
MSYNISPDQIQELKTQYCNNRGHRFVNRIYIVLALARGYKVYDLALIFMLDDDTIRRYFHLYNEGGIDGLLENHYKGRPSYLTDEQKEKLKEHLRQNRKKLPNSKVERVYISGIVVLNLFCAFFSCVLCFKKIYVSSYQLQLKPKIKV